MLVTSIFSFSDNVFKGSFLRGLKSLQTCVWFRVKRLTNTLITELKGGPSDLGTKIYKNTKKNHPYTPKAF